MSFDDYSYVIGELSARAARAGQAHYPPLFTVTQKARLACLFLVWYDYFRTVQILNDKGMPTMPFLRRTGRPHWTTPHPVVPEPALTARMALWGSLCYLKDMEVDPKKFFFFCAGYGWESQSQNFPGITGAFWSPQYIFFISKKSLEGGMNFQIKATPMCLYGSKVNIQRHAPHAVLVWTSADEKARVTCLKKRKG